MDRIQSFIGQTIYEWDISKPDQNTMVALAKLCSSVFGSGGMANGLACTQTTVPSMQVSIGQGELYQMASLEASTSGTLPADTTNTIMKQGILLGSAAPVNLPASSTFAAPGTAGQSVNYLIEAQYQDQDVSVDPTTGASPVVLNFYNSSNPATPWSGPGNAGTSSNTFRKGVIAFQVKAGSAATTGTQVTPSPDSGWIGLYVVTVANGQATVLNANISVYPAAPFVGQPVSQGRLLNTQVFTSSGTYTPTPGMRFAIVDVQGGGAAAAGGAQITTSGNASMGAPGTCGSFGRGLFTASAIGASLAITVGAGGTGISGAAGNAGGASSFGALLSAAGGISGGALNNFVAAPLANGNGNLSAVPSGANLWSSQGACEGQSLIINAGTGAGFLPGTGGRSVYGIGGGGALNTTPAAAVSPGSGGGGVIILNGFGPFAGGAGAKGMVTISEYA